MMDNEEVMINRKDRPQTPRQMDEIFDILILWIDMVDSLPLAHSLEMQGQKLILNFFLSKSYMCHSGIIASFNWVVSR